MSHNLWLRWITRFLYFLSFSWSEIRNFLNEILTLEKQGRISTQMSADSTVRVSYLSEFPEKSCPVSVYCPDFLSCVFLSELCLSRFCPNFPGRSVRYLSAVWMLSTIVQKMLSDVCLSGRTRRQSCPDFHCPCPPTSELNLFTWLRLSKNPTKS